MEKSEMMKRYEEETGETLDMSILSGDATGSWYGFLDSIEAKATAYDRLMSGGRKTLKEWANIFGMYFAVGKSGIGYAYKYKPLLASNNFRGPWFSVICPEFIDYTGDWKDSLTLPDR